MRGGYRATAVDRIVRDLFTSVPADQRYGAVRLDFWDCMPVFREPSPPRSLVPWRGRDAVLPDRCFRVVAWPVEKAPLTTTERVGGFSEEIARAEPLRTAVQQSRHVLVRAPQI